MQHILPVQGTHNITFARAVCTRNVVNGNAQLPYSIYNTRGLRSKIPVDPDVRNIVCPLLAYNCTLARVLLLRSISFCSLIFVLLCCTLILHFFLLYKRAQKFSQLMTVSLVNGVKYFCRFSILAFFFSYCFSNFMMCTCTRVKLFAANQSHDSLLYLFVRLP